MRVGVQVHRVLSHHKLFCRCRYHHTRGPDESYQTRLYEMPTSFRGSRGQHCDYERDEVPAQLHPRILCRVAKILARIPGLTPLSTVVFSRKEILDGSLPMGYQITGIVGVGGVIVLQNGRSVPIDTVTLEADSATPEQGAYRVDRMGIPLLQVTTHPAQLSPLQIRDLLERIQWLINPLGLMPRGPHAIRQDINLSTPDHPARIELKGINSLSVIPLAVSHALQRMRHHPETQTTTHRVRSDGSLEFLRYPLGASRMTLETQIPPTPIPSSRSNSTINPPLSLLRGRVTRPRHYRYLQGLMKRHGYYSFDRPVLEMTHHKPELYRVYLEGSMPSQTILRGRPVPPMELSELQRLYSCMDSRDFYLRYRPYLTRSFRIWRQTHTQSPPINN